MLKVLLCVTSGVLKSVLFIHITFNDHDREQMLKVLLCVTSGVLKSVPPRERHQSLGGRLAQPIFQVSSSLDRRSCSGILCM